MADMEAVLQKTVDYFGGHIPGVAAFLVKIIVCIVIYIIGKNVIGWVVKTVRSMLLRTKMQTGAATFIVSMVKIFLYLILIFGLAMQFGVRNHRWQHSSLRAVWQSALLCRADFQIWRADF